MLSVPMVLEYEAVLKRPEHLKAADLNSSDIDQLLDALCAIAQAVEMNFLWRPSLADPNDEMVLETAFNGKADLLLTFNIKDFAPAKTLGIAVSKPGPAWSKFMKV